MPEVTSRSPFWKSALSGMKRSSSAPSLPVPDEHRAQAVAHVLHRHDLVLVGDQRDLGKPRIDARHLADDAAVVDHRLAGLHAVLRALVDRRSCGENGSRAA